MTQRGWKALVFGDKGAAGKELVNLLLGSQNWKKVSVVLPKKYSIWDDLKDEHMKLDLRVCEDFEKLFDLPQWQYKGYLSTFCTLETTKAEGRAPKDVEHDYTLQIAKIAKLNLMAYFGVLMGVSTDPASVANYLKQQGENERNILTLQIPFVSIFKPGMLLHNDADKTVTESLVSKAPLLPTIDAKDIAKAMKIDAELRLDGKDKKIDAELRIKDQGYQESKYHFYDNANIKGILNLSS